MQRMRAQVWQRPFGLGVAAAMHSCYSLVCRSLGYGLEGTVQVLGSAHKGGPQKT